MDLNEPNAGTQVQTVTGIKRSISNTEKPTFSVFFLLCASN